MKILQLVQKRQLRGAEVFTAQLSTHIDQSGHKAILVFLYPGSEELPFGGTMAQLDGNIKKRFRDISAWRKLAGIIKKEKPDVIQANAGDTLKYAVFSKIIFRWKQPIIFRNASTISLYIKSRSAIFWNRFFFGYVHTIISVSNASALDFGKLYPVFKEKIITIPIGIEPGKPDDKEPRCIVNDTQPSDTPGPVLIHVGGFTFEKNHVGLLSIFEIILQQRPDATLHLYGDGPLKGKIETLVAQKGLRSQVQFYGFQKNVLSEIRKADVLLLPSIIEGLPGVILEAFYCKTPVVAYDVGGISEVLINDETGRLTRKGDEQAFANSVLEALSNGEQNNYMVENAFSLVTTHYLNTHIASRFMNVYKSLVTV
ncbi:MAG TPA: glycosyltransferase [Chitinophagaceae bacterium]|nr:glycosyltransferase [Chitinophagaceae bacterium]